MESITEFATANLQIIAGIIAIAALWSAYISNYRFRLWLRDFWVTFPLIGSIARLSKDRTQGSAGWLRAEEKLCGIYKPFVALMKSDMFDQRIEYLRKAADLGRTPTPMWVWFLLIVLVIAEGLGFSYLLGSWMAREGSANTHTLLMFAIVLVLCVILVALTHYAGHQYYRTSLLRSCFARFKEKGSQEYAVETISLNNKNQGQDDGSPDFKQTINRVAKHSHDVGSYAAGIIAIIAIAFIAIVSTYMRVKNMEGEMIRESATLEQPAAGNPFAQPVLPDEVAAAQGKADRKAKTEATQAMTDEGLAAFAMLGFIFVVTQIVGMGAGYKYGFAGRESGAAHKSLGGFSTYEDYLAYFQPLRDLVNGRMKDLQQRLERNSHTKLELHKTFDDYLLEQQDQTGQLIRGINTAVAPPASAAVSAPVAMPRPEAPTPTQALAAEPAVPAAPAAPAAPVVRSLSTVKAEFERLDDAEAEKQYFLSLPAALRSDAALQAWLKDRKAQRAAAATVAVDELF